MKTPISRDAAFSADSCTGQGHCIMRLFQKGNGSIKRVFRHDNALTFIKYWKIPSPWPGQSQSTLSAGNMMFRHYGTKAQRHKVLKKISVTNLNCLIVPHAFTIKLIFIVFPLCLDLYFFLRLALIPLILLVNCLITEKYISPAWAITVLWVAPGTT